MAEEARLRLGQNHAVYDTGVCVLVRNDQVAGPHEPADGSHVGTVAAREDHRRFFAFERGHFLSELLVDFRSSTQDGRS